MQTATMFNHETVVMDGESFVDCEFRDCRLVYSGGQAPAFKGCRFDNCDWRMEGAAASTLEHLKGIWAAGGKAAVQVMIKEITGAAK